MDHVKLYSWVDVKDQLFQLKEEGQWPDDIKAEIYVSGVYLYYQSPQTKDGVVAWVSSIWPNAFDDGKIKLEGEDRYTHVFIEEVEEIEPDTFLPIFARPSDISNKTGRVVERSSNGSDPIVIAVHSFKGGVGRTLHAMALSIALEELAPAQKILFIDADFEAPGTSWLTPDAEISLADVLNLVHSSESIEAIIPLIGRNIQNQGKGDIYFLPAFRHERQMRSLEIKPENIFRFNENPFILSDLLVSLANELNVSYVIIDLRAGMSELSANWLLDPLISKILVTTLNGQSIEGTKMLLDVLAEQQLNYKLKPVEAPFVIVSQVPSQIADSLENVWNRIEEPSSSTASRNIHELREAYFSYLEKISELSEDDSNGITGEKNETPVTISPHYDSLLVLPNNWEVVKELIKSSGLSKKINSLAQIFLTTPQAEEDNASDITAARQTMHQILPDLIYAERIISNEFYRSNAIRNLANRNLTRLPNLVIIGAKGAGKTFLFRQILKSGQWDAFLKKAIDPDDHSSFIKGVDIVAATFPENLDVEDEGIRSVWQQRIKPFLVESLSGDYNLNGWRDIWMDVMAWSAGYKVGSIGVGTEFIEDLVHQEHKKVFLFDGLEDLFYLYYADSKHQTALQALLQYLPSYIGSIPNAPIGMIAFIRQDILNHVIKQNLNQFTERYKEYILTWDRTEALRLVAWILIYYNILKTTEEISQETVLYKSEEVLTKYLTLLWGRKLGGNNSREAYSAKKILNTLSNFKQEVQSRDLVRFLAEAIKQEVSTTGHGSDRILSAKSITNAFPEVGRQKVEEVKQENRGNDYAIVLEKLINSPDPIRVPFEVSSSPLTKEEIKTLVDQGVLRQYNNKYYMAELFRLGLGVERGKGKIKTEFRP